MNRLVNLRDVGGLAVSDGGVTRYGVLYRSDAPHAGDAVPDHITNWPPRTVVDLRTEKEAARARYELLGSEHVLYPLHHAAAPANIRTADIRALYRHILETVAERVAAAVTHVVSRPGPALVHCTAGKDRTGIVIASLLLAAGVAPDDVVADYLRTSDNMDAVLRRISVHHDLDRFPVSQSWLLTPAEAIGEVVDVLMNLEHDGADGWLLAHGTPKDALDTWLDGFVEQSHPRDDVGTAEHEGGPTLLTSAAPLP